MSTRVQGARSVVPWKHNSAHWHTLSREPAWAWRNRRPRPGPGRDAASAGTSCPKAQVPPWPRVGAGPVLDGPTPRRGPGQCCHWHWQRRVCLKRAPSEMGRPLGTGTSESAPFAEPIRRPPQSLTLRLIRSATSVPIPNGRNKRGQRQKQRGRREGSCHVLGAFVRCSPCVLAVRVWYLLRARAIK